MPNAVLTPYYVEEGTGLADWSGNFGYPLLHDIVAAVLQKADELSFATTENLL
jgi:hypothetical protein